jgi:hypothetical protein
MGLGFSLCSAQAQTSVDVNGKFHSRSCQGSDFNGDAPRARYHHVHRTNANFNLKKVQVAMTGDQLYLPL